MFPVKANQTVLEAISRSEGPITLGLLPLSEQEEEACIRDVRIHCAGRLRTLLELLHIYTPAAASYAIAAGASQAVSQGSRFWEPLGDMLMIDLSAPLSRESLSVIFSKACENLGVVTPDVSDLAWKYAAPIMTQASILHRWTDALGAGIQTTLKFCPMPDLDDPRALEMFATVLAQHTHSQPNLRSILQTQVGPIVVHRLISSCIYNRYEILPAHLVEPMKQAFEGGGRQVTLKSPYVSFSMIHGGFELVLPKQSGKLISHQTYWLVKSSQYSPVTEERLSEFELGTGTVDVQLKKLTMGYPDQEFTVNLSLNQSFRLFEEKTMRERSVHVGEETTVPPGDYLVIMKQDATTNDATCEEMRGTYKVLSGVALRPGLEPLTIVHNDIKSSLSAALKAGIYQSTEEGQFTTLSNGMNLHYGDVIGFQAFIPKNQHSGMIDIQISNGDSVLLKTAVPLQAQDHGVYDYSQDLENALHKAIDLVRPGIHRLQIRLATNVTSIIRDFWYWKGLKRISNHLGFLCSEPPENIDYRGSKGIEASEDGCGFPKNTNRPRILILLKGGSAIELLRPGIQATCIDPSDNWQVEIGPHENLTVKGSDTRVIQLESGGFEEWSLCCNGKEFAQLSQRKTVQIIGLHSLLSDFGKSGRVCAVNGDGEEIRLFGFSSSLLATALILDLDHGIGLEKWTTKIPLEGVGKLGLIVRDYSESPIPADTPVVPLVDEENLPENGLEVTVDVKDGVSAVIRCLPAQGNLEARVKVCIQISPERTSNSLLAIDVVQMPPKGDQWNPLLCVDGPSTSQLCIVTSGSAEINHDCCTWWHHLWRVSQNSHAVEDGKFYESLTNEEIGEALTTISRFTTTKYPTSVYSHSARYLSSLAFKLSSRRKSCGHLDDDIWWCAAATELENHADAVTFPVVRTFLFSNNPHVLRRIWRYDKEISSSSRSNVIPCLSLVTNIRNSGGRVGYAQKVIHEGRHPYELFSSFKNWRQVSEGQATEFQNFDFNFFFKGILKRALQHAESAVVADEIPILSARHLLRTINALNRRVRVLTRASSGDAEHPLSITLLSLSGTHAKLESRIVSLNSSIGYRPEGHPANLDHPDHFEPLYYPDLPCLSGVQAKQIADLTWAFCIAIRAKAHGRMCSNESKEIFTLFSGFSTPTHPINMILSFAPELFSYYVGLFDFALYNPEPTNH